MKPFDRITSYRKDKLFSVELGGVIVAEGISRAIAAGYLANRGKACCRIYLTERPIEGRTPAWRPASVPRQQTRGPITDAQRVKIITQLRADGIMADEP